MPPIANRYARPWKYSVPLPPEPPMNQPAFSTEIRMVPPSARAAE